MILFQLWLMQGPGRGKCGVYVDGVLVQTVDCYAATENGPIMLAQNLPLDLHRVQIVWEATKNASATGTRIGRYAWQVML